MRLQRFRAGIAVVRINRQRRVAAIGQGQLSGGASGAFDRAMIDHRACRDLRLYFTLPNRSVGRCINGARRESLPGLDRDGKIGDQSFGQSFNLKRYLSFKSVLAIDHHHQFATSAFQQRGADRSHTWREHRIGRANSQTILIRFAAFAASVTQSHKKAIR